MTTSLADSVKQKLCFAAIQYDVMRLICHRSPQFSTIPNYQTDSESTQGLSSPPYLISNEDSRYLTTEVGTKTRTYQTEPDDADRYRRDPAHGGCGQETGRQAGSQPISPRVTDEKPS